MEIPLKKQSSHNKFKSSRKNLNFDGSEHEEEHSPEIDANRLTAWLEKSEKVTTTYDDF